MRRYLITTSHQGTWKDDVPVLFLGEWCLQYKHRAIWSALDAKVAEPFGIDIEKKKLNQAYLKNLFNEILGELEEVLNAYHGTKHSKRYWHILLGHWLYRSLSVAFNRYHTLAFALERYDLSGTAIFQSAPYALTTADSRAFIDACNDNLWNNVFYSRVMAFINHSIKLDYIQPSKNDASSLANLAFRKPQNEARRLARIVDAICSKFSCAHDAFIATTYLPRIEEIKLFLSLGFFPQLRVSPELRRGVLKEEKRATLNFAPTGRTDFERFFRAVLPELLPVCFVEGYASLIQQVATLRWPSSPKFIFTSVRFYTDELFKAWAASKAETGTPYFIGQHGNYGVSPFMMADDDSVECRTPDFFLTWGYTNNNNKNIPVFNFKIAGKPLENYDRNGGLLLIEACPSHPMTHWDSHYEFGIYQNEQFEFVGALPMSIKQQLTVRLHSGARNYEWDDENRWRDYDSSIQVENGSESIEALIKRSRLVVHSYDSTGVLETLALNIPTLCFWPGCLAHLHPSAIPFYELLLHAGILAKSPKHAAQTVQMKWGTIEHWWKSAEIQMVREQFCEEYSRRKKYPILSLKRELNALTKRMKR